MKNTLIVALLLCVFMAHAQNRPIGTTPSNTTTVNKSSYSTVQFGIKAGVNLAKLTNSGPEVFDYRTGFHAGALAHIHITPSFAIQPELVYSLQGAKFSGGTDQFDYLNIPVLFQFLFGDGFRLQTGPQLGILTSAKFKNASNNAETDVKKLLRGTDFSWSFGASYLSSIGLGVDARYNLGITDITLEGTPEESKNRVWQFGLFYQFMR
jgi:hypothetical protein